MEIMTLFKQVAKHLTGRDVMFRWQEPVWNNTSGAAYKSLSGDAIIDVNPGASDPVYTFLHECAHVRLDFSQMAPSAYWRCEPGSQITPEAERAELRALPREDRADQLAKIWLDYSKRYAWRYFAPTLFEGQLLALVDYPKMEIEND